MNNLLSKKRSTPFRSASYAYASEEDRCAPRYKFAIPAKMRFSGSGGFGVTITNMSVAGFGCDALLQIQPGTRCWITLPGLSSLEAEVIHNSNYGLGCAFANLLSPAVLDRYIAHYPAPEPV